jgi:hypothetical protein
VAVDAAGPTNPLETKPAVCVPVPAPETLLAVDIGGADIQEVPSHNSVKAELVEPLGDPPAAPANV